MRISKGNGKVLSYVDNVSKKVLKIQLKRIMNFWNTYAYLLSKKMAKICMYYKIAEKKFYLFSCMMRIYKFP